MNAYRTNVVPLFPGIEATSFLKCPHCLTEIVPNPKTFTTASETSWGNFSKELVPTFSGDMVPRVVGIIGPQRPRFCRGKTWIVRFFRWLSPVRSLEPPCPRGDHLYVHCSYCSYHWIVLPRTP